MEVSKGRISVSTHSSLTLRSMTYQNAQRQVTKTGLTAWLLNNNIIMIIVIITMAIKQ